MYHDTILYTMKEKELLRICTAGSVDDGKSTLIGRLLFDTDQVYDDQLAAIRRASDDPDNPDLSLLTDGLAAEREQKITIDVAYRYFSTEKRRFIVADVPGHEQYTKNMVTGASNAQVGLILIDARKGLITQSKRHLFVASLLKVPHIAIIVNKMDLVAYSEERFTEIKQEVLSFVAKLDIPDFQFIPASAYAGDNVVTATSSMPWYKGRTILDYLNTIEVESDKNLIDFRFPVQQVLRPNQDTRVYIGTLESGTVRVGEEVMILPSKKMSRIKSLTVGFDSVESVSVPQAVGMELTDERDISRGEMIVRPNNLPFVSNSFDAMITWFDAVSLKPKKRYIIKHTTKETYGNIETLHYELDIDTLHRKNVDTLPENGVGKVQIVTSEPLLYDLYATNRYTGSFIVIDPDTNQTAGAGTIIKAKEDIAAMVATDTKQVGTIVWFTGLSGSGKSTIADGVYDVLKAKGMRVVRLDGDVMREAFGDRFGFSEEDRRLNVDIAAFTARELAKQGVTVLASFISPYRDQREVIKASYERVVEVFVDTPLDVCEARDVKGLYKKVRSGEIDAFTGITSPYEIPSNPTVHIRTQTCSIDDAVSTVVEYI